MSAGFFKSMLAVMRKELLDITRDRRTLAMAVLFTPLMFPLMMLGVSSLGEMRMKTQLEAELELPVIGAERAPNLVDFLASQRIRAVEPPEDIVAAIASQQVDVALEIGESFDADWRAGRPAPVDIIHDATRRNAEIPVARVRSALSAYGEQVGALRLVARGIDPSITRPLGIGHRDLASEEASRGMVLSLLLPYLLILSSFLGGAYLILDATAGERERQSLEPLLATPAARGAIVSGKMVAACSLGLLSLLLTLLALKASAQLGESASMLDVSFGAMLRMLLVLVPMLFIGTALLSLLAASAKSMKEAQSHMTWLMLLPMVPAFVLMVNPVKSEMWQYAVPFLAQNQLLLKIIRAEAIDPLTWTVYLAAGFGLATVLWLGAVARYRQEKLAVSA
ncbi:MULTISPECIES: ABC transporter permease [unclassified Luteimonas]